MSTPLASKTTVSSRNKIAHLNNNNGTMTNQCNNTNNKQIPQRSRLQPPSQISRPTFRTPAPPHHSQSVATTGSAQRLANLANGLPISMISRASSSSTSTTTTTTTTNSNNHSGPNVIPSANQASESRIGRVSGISAVAETPAIQNGRPISCLTTRPQVRSFASRNATSVTATTSRIQAPRSKFKIETPSLNSRSSSVLSSVSSATTTAKRASTTTSNHVVKKPPNNSSRDIPETNVTRKGLAKFSNPIECQRQIQTLNAQIQELTDINDTRDKDIIKLQDQLKQSIDQGLGYATVVQYFAKVLKIDSDIDLPKKCGMLEEQIDALLLKEKNSVHRLECIVDDYKSHLKSEYDLKNKLISELEDTRIAHKNELEALIDEHKREMIDLDNSRTVLKQELETRIHELQTDLESKIKEHAELRKEHEQLNNDFNKLEESMTKDKDAKVRYLQDKIAQLQKDVDSLNSVLEMRLEKIHALEKDSILLTEAQNENGQLKDSNKALGQQLESLNAALERKRELYENLLVEHENVVQELKKERKERRRMTMKTEQLEYVLNESCTDNNITVFNSSVIDPDRVD